MATRLDQQKITDHQDWLEARRELANSIDVDQYAYKLTFGRFAGRPITSIPSNYLVWLRHKSNIIPLVERCANELERRRRIGITHKWDRRY